MAIRMIPPGFPERRRRDPKRRAEARFVDILEKVRLNGWILYEFRYRRGGKQVDFLLWIDDKGRFAVQVKGGRYEMDEDGQWFLIKPDGTRSPVPCPFEETQDGCMEMKNAIEEAAGFTHFVAGVTVFPDMERDARMEEVARRRNHVYVIWGLDHLSGGPGAHRGRSGFQPQARAQSLPERMPQGEQTTVPRSCGPWGGRPGDAGRRLGPGQ